MKKNHYRKSSFTMVELLLVLAILGTLAVIVVPKLSGRSEQARITAARTEINAIKTAMTAFEIDNGRFPTAEEGLNALTFNPGNLPNWRGYLDSAVVSDPWGNPYQYEVPGSRSVAGYDVYSMGPDGKPRTADDIGNWLTAE